MSIQKHASKHRVLAHAVLPLALAAVLISRNSDVRAAETWRNTRTEAALLRVAVPPAVPSPGTSTNNAPSTSSPSLPAPASHWAFNVGDEPQVHDDIVVTPLNTNGTLRIVVTLAMRNREQFYQALHDIYDPASPSFRKYMTPHTYKAAYGPTDEDAQKVVAYLQEKGFTDVKASPTNQIIMANGKPSELKEAFKVSMQQFTLDGEQFFGNEGAVQVPESLAHIVDGVLGLQNISVKHTYNHMLAPAEGEGVDISHSSTAFQKIYHTGDSPTAYATDVAVIGWNDQAQTQKDLDLFTTANALDKVKMEVVKVPANAAFPKGDEAEWAMDTQTIVGVSGGVRRLLFYTAPEPTDGDVAAVETRVVDDNIAKLINCSFGENEADPAHDSAQSYEDDLFARAEAQGQIFSISSGDTGAYTWARDESWEKKADKPSDFSRYSVSWPAASSHVVAVGGTTLFTDALDSTVRTGEVTWNDGIIGDGTFWASGGGPSHFIAAPEWQQNAIGDAADVHRVVPDLAFDASGSVVIINGLTWSYGGTSLSSPIFVGAFARIETAANNSIGLPSRDMYRDFRNGGHAEILHDITVGNNGITMGEDVFGFSAGRGFDRVTGWGSFDIDRLRLLAVDTWGDRSAPPKPPVKPAAVAIGLQNGVAVQASGKPDVDTRFVVELPARVRFLNIRAFGGSGDVAMYVKYKGPASAASFDYVSDHWGTNNESVTIPIAGAGAYHVTLRSPVTFANLHIEARYQP